MVQLLCGASKDFMKVLKTFIKPFEAPQRIVKIKVNFLSLSGIRTGRVRGKEPDRLKDRFHTWNNVILLRCQYWTLKYEVLVSALRQLHQHFRLFLAKMLIIILFWCFVSLLEFIVLKRFCVGSLIN